MGDMADSPEREAMEAVLTNFNEGNGKHDRLPRPRRSDRDILLAVALARSGIASRGTAVLLGLGAAVSLIAAPGPIKPIALTGAVLLIGGAAQRRASRREVMPRRVRR